MIRRVPYARHKAYEMVPDVLAETVSDVRAFFKAATAAGHLDAENLMDRLIETDAAEQKLRSKTPPNVTEMIETPWPTQSMLTCLFGMTWRFLPSNGPSYFLTSDNPAYFFEAYGLGSELSELIFPLSRKLALHCCWQNGANCGMLTTHQKMVKEFNRRIACGANRFIFYHEEQDRVLSVAQNRVEQLNRIQW